MKSLFFYLEFPRGMGHQVDKSWKFQGVGGVRLSPWNGKSSGVGDSNWKKTLHGGGMDIF